MANGVNKVILVGNLGRDPEIQSFDNGVKKAAFSLATTEVFRKEGEKNEHTEWHNIVLWRGLAEVAEKYLRKGSTVYIEGKIRKREYEDKEKQKRFIYEIIADSMTMLGGGPRRDGAAPEDAGNGASAYSPEPSAGGAEGADDLPF
jgi:single-strand DNA-binding protein